jgi:hypothetical protein
MAFTPARVILARCRRCLVGGLMVLWLMPAIAAIVVAALGESAYVLGDRA